jgi:hypothetical protein
MNPASACAQEVMLDASPICRFAEHGLLEPMRRYLGDRARITREVERELQRLSGQQQFPQIREYLCADGTIVRSDGKWPQRTGQLPSTLRADYVNLLQGKRRFGEHERAHSGEIATVLMAQHRGADLVVIDDGWGKNLAKSRGLQTMTTARLVLEMVVAGLLSEEQGFTVYDGATPAEVGRSRYEESLSRLRTGQ